MHGNILFLYIYSIYNNIYYDIRVKINFERNKNYNKKILNFSILKSKKNIFFAPGNDYSMKITTK